MPYPTLVPVMGMVEGVKTGADEELGPMGEAVVGAGADAGTGDGGGTGAVGTARVGTGVAAEARYEDGAVAEPEGYVCLDAEEGADRLPFPPGGALWKFWISAAIFSISRFLFWWYVLHQLLICASLSSSRPLSLMAEMHSTGSALIP